MDVPSAGAPSKACTATLSLHTADQSEEELLLSQELLDDLRISRGCFVEIRAVRALTTASGDSGCDTGSPGGPSGVGAGHGCACASAGGTFGGCGECGGRSSTDPAGLGSLVLQIGGAAPPKGSHSVSVLAAAAALYGLASRASVELVVVTPAAAYLEWVEMVFKDQYLSRGDIWYWMQQLIDQCVFCFVFRNAISTLAQHNNCARRRFHQRLEGAEGAEFL